MQLDDGQGVSGWVHSGPGLSPSPHNNALSDGAAMWMSPPMLPPARPLAAPAAAPDEPTLRPSYLPPPQAPAPSPSPSPAALGRLYIPQDPVMPPPRLAAPQTPNDPFQLHMHDAVRPMSAPADAWRRQDSLDGSGMFPPSYRAQMHTAPIGNSANRRKRGSCDPHVGTGDAAEAARSAAQLVAAQVSTPRHAAWDRGANSGPLEECVHGSGCGSTRLSAQSEPLQTTHRSDLKAGGSARGGGERRSPRAPGFAAAATRRSLLRQRSGGAVRLAGARRALRGAEGDRSSSGALADRAADEPAQQASTAAALPPLTAMEGRLRPLPTLPITFQAREAAARSRLSRRSYSHLPCESIREVAMEALVADGDGEPMLASDAMFGAAFAELDAPCDTTLLPAAAAHGAVAEAQLHAATAARVRQEPQPATPFTTPRSPSPQRLCRRLETPTVPALAPGCPARAGGAATHEPDLAQALGSHGPESGGLGDVARQAPGGQQLLRPPWMSRAREPPEDPEEQKRQLAVQRFNEELHCRLAAQGIGDGVEHEGAVSVVAAPARPRGQAPAERARERQFVEKGRLEESTLSALAALMKQ